MKISCWKKYLSVNVLLLYVSIFWTNKAKEKLLCQLWQKSLSWQLKLIIKAESLNFLVDWLALKNVFSIPMHDSNESVAVTIFSDPSTL